ncbi:MAG: MBL fold metallo-hydrolase [Gemmatimonadota bacterium]
MLVALVAAAIGACSRTPAATQPENVLRAALAAHGGQAAIERIGTLDLRFTGLREMSYQSRRADPPWDQEPSSVRLVFSQARNHWLWETINSYPGLGPFGVRQVFDSLGGFFIDPDGNSHGPEVMRVTAAEALTSRHSLARFIPGLLIEQAIDSVAAARVLGSDRVGGERHIQVLYRDPFGREITLRFDAKSYELTAYTFTRRDEVRGVAAESVHFAKYSDYAGLRLPLERREYINGELERALSATVRFGFTDQDSLFQIPDGYVEPTPAGIAAHQMDHDAAATLRPIGRGIHIDVATGTMVVEFADHTVAFDCPNDARTSQRTIAAVAGAFPTKPIRYLVASHTHPDHCGGARAYFAAGIPIIVARDHVGFYERLARTSHASEPDGYNAATKPPKIESIDAGASRVLRDATMSVELFNIGPSPHSAEMLVGHLPQEGLLWQVDLFLGRMTGGVGNARPVSDWLAREIERRRWAVRRIVDTHLGMVFSREAVDSSLRMAGFRPIAP